jgi:hypothetical protein
MFTWTENPYETMWSHLRLLSHVTNAEALLRGELGPKGSLASPSSPLLEVKARQVAYCILQAYEYYQAAQAVTIHTSPLLYFYGMLSLAKAVIIAKEPTTVLDDIKYHGLKVDKFTQSVKLEEQAAVAHGGVFEHLCSVIQKSTCHRGAVIKLKDILSISPELGEMYERFFREPARSIKDYDTQVISTTPFHMTVSTPKASLGEIFERLPELASDFEVSLTRIHDHALAFESKPGMKEHPDYFGRYAAVVGGRYVVGALPMLLNSVSTKLYLSPPLSDYIAMFILSDCVRYKQDLWGDVVQGRETGILGVIDLLMTVSKRRFPNMILDHLFGEHFDYGAPGRIS